MAVLKFAKNPKVDIGNAVNLDHPLNRVKSAWWLGLIGAGSRLPNLMSPNRFQAPFVGTLVRWIPDGRNRHALSFPNNTSHYVDTGATVAQLGISTAQSITVTWWQRPRTAFNTSTIRAVWGSGNGTPEFSCQVFSDNNWYVGFASSGAAHRVQIPATADNWTQDKWSFYALVCNSGSVSILYQNGREIGRNAGVTTFQNPTSSILLGRQSIETLNPYSGDLGDYAVYLRGLSQSEIFEVYQQSLVGYNTSNSLLNFLKGTAYSLPLLVPQPKKIYAPRSVQTVTSFGRKSVDVGNSVNLDHPLNRGMAVWLRGTDSGNRLCNAIPWNRFHANLQNGTKWTSSPVGPALSMVSSSSQHAVFSGQVGPSSWTGATFQTVIRTRSALSGFQNPFISSNNLGLAISGNGQNATYFWTNDALDYDFNSGLSYTVGQWMYHAVVVRPDRATVYLGNLQTGVLRSATRVATHAARNGGALSNWFLGSDRLVGGRYLNGEITDCKISPNVSLNDAEIYESFNQARCGYNTPNSQLNLLKGTTFGLPLELTETRTYGARTKLTLAPSSSFDVGSLPDLSQPINKGRVAWYLSHKSNGSRLVNAIPGGMFPGTLNLAQPWQPTGLGDYGVLNTADGANIPLSGNLNASEATFCLAVRPSQTIGAYAGLIFSRPQVTGLLTNGLGELTVAWNGQLWSWMTGVTIPVNEFSLLWGSISPTGATVLRYSRAGRWHNTTTNTNAPHLIQDFVIGADTYDPVGRQVKGLLANGSIWNRALTLQEMVEESARYFQGYKVPYSSIRLLQRPVYFPFPGSAGGGGGTGRIPRLISPTRRRLIGVS